MRSTRAAEAVAELGSLGRLARMEQSERKGWMWGRCALAFFLALVFLGIVLPNSGRVVIDQTTTPPTPHIVGRVRDGLLMVGIAVVPLALVIAGIFRRSQMEIPGWILLFVLVVIGFMK